MTSESQQRESKLLIEYAARAGEQFVSLYYSAYDSRNRAGLIPTLYVPQSTVVWNGNPIPGSNGVADLMNGLPATKHDVQTLDAQPVGGGSNSGSFHPPSLLVTVAGVVTHHTPTSASALPPSNAPQSRNRSGNQAAQDPSLPLDALPRAFSQSFVLVHDPEGKGQGGVLVSWDANTSMTLSSSNNKGGRSNGQSQAQSQQAPTIHGRYFVQADQMRFVG
ncbi:unnamed protein product [Jaminaea pallidilutea]